MEVNTVRASVPGRPANKINGSFDLAMLEKCKKADILEKAGALICQARVSVGRTGEIILVIPRSATYKFNSAYPVVFYDPVLGRVTCRCRLSAPLPLPGGELYSLRCEVVEQLSQEQRRQDVKIPMNMTIMLHAAYQPGDPVRTSELGTPAVIGNLSAGGVYLRTALPLPKGRRIWFDLMVGKEKMTLSAKVVWMETTSPKPGQIQYGYGCQFVNLLSRQESALRSFIFQEERRQRRPE